MWYALREVNRQALGRDRRQPGEKIGVVLDGLEVVEHDQARCRFEVTGQQRRVLVRRDLADVVADEGGSDLREDVGEGRIGGAVDPDATAGNWPTAFRALTLARVDFPTPPMPCSTTPPPATRASTRCGGRHHGR